MVTNFNDTLTHKCIRISNEHQIEELTTLFGSVSTSYILCLGTSQLIPETIFHESDVRLRDLQTKDPRELIDLSNDATRCITRLCQLLMKVVFNIKESKIRQYVLLEVLKPAPVHFCTDFTSTATATLSTYGRVVVRLGTFLQAVSHDTKNNKVVYKSRIELFIAGNISVYAENLNGELIIPGFG
ncbi:hypothetical protein RF11_15588 [Thelohanellus kitauei]|uniref:Uncharacterized protein n=1 Tax=Thelohanellus kitauei TaxID=669202 RepID=A0A0C2JDQ0_THEKT|nr:hypothetical protein RF11_15588 [Thelohanellus kitauei]